MLNIRKKRLNTGTSSNKLTNKIGSLRFKRVVLPDERTCAIRILQTRRQETDNEQFLQEFGIRYQNIFYGSRRWLYPATYKKIKIKINRKS